MPTHAVVRAEDCSFERGICGWYNMTHADPNERLTTWQMAADMHRPNQLPDKTFGTTGNPLTVTILFKVCRWIVHSPIACKPA